MTIEEIEENHGLPCQVKMPYGSDGRISGYLIRDILRKHKTREDWYIQSNPKRPQDGEFVMCCGDKKHNKCEFVKNI